MLIRFIKKNFSKIISIIVFMIMIWAIYEYLDKFYILFHNPILIKELILSYEPYSLFAFILLQFFQVVIFAIPGEVVQMAGGYIYGTNYGTIFSIVGIGIGSTLTFFLANLLGKKYVLKILSKKHIKFLDKIIEYGGNKGIIFIMYLIPGIPKDILGYICGITDVRFKDFIIYSTLGRIPGIILSASFGANIVDKNYTFIAILSTITIILLVISLFRGEQLISKLLKKDEFRG